MTPVPFGKIQIEVTLSEETLKELFAAVALHQLLDAKRVWPQQVDHYVTSAREVANAMMKARKEDSK